MKLVVVLILSLIAIIQAVPDCNAYCGNITANCNGTFAQYTNMAHCMAMCGAWPVGLDSDTGNNTLGCRLYHANAAATLGTVHCYHAGPYGADLATNGSICGSQCEAYCSIMTYKPGCNDSLRAFNSMQECMNICPSFPSSMTLYFDNATGNTLQCRIYHAKVAFSGGAATLNTHCAHAAPLGGGQCGNPVDNYCSILDTSCKGIYAQFPTVAYCKDFAKYLNNDTNFYDYSGDTIACKAYHAVVGGAGGPASIHCYHGGAAGNGTGTCGTSMCDSFCNLTAKICPTNYASTSACVTACNGWTSKLGAPADTDADSFYCRLYHLGAAAKDAASATTHCPHTLGNSSTCIVGSSPTPTPTPTPNPNTPTPNPNTPTPGPGTPAPGSSAILGFSVLLAFFASLF